MCVDSCLYFDVSGLTKSVCKKCLSDLLYQGKRTSISTGRIKKKVYHVRYLNTMFDLTFESYTIKVKEIG